MERAITALFERYARETRAALAGAADEQAIAALYDEAFIAASPAGVRCGANSDAFIRQLVDGFSHYRAIGTKAMTVESVKVDPIDALHALARVAWRAIYDVRGDETAIDFSNVYLVRVDARGARVFGWITGDEQAVLREHGVIA